MNNLQQLTAKIYASNPELMTLGVGCEIQNPVTLQTYSIGIFVSESYCVLDNKDRLPLTVNNKIVDFYRVIGKPHTLVYVLKWLAELGWNVGQPSIQGFLLNWNLNSIYLRDQSPELINFLLNLEK